MSRFIDDPFIFTKEVNYHDWSYNEAALTICSDYANESFIDDYYKRSKNVTSINRNSSAYQDYSRYMKIIGSLNAENIDSIVAFEKTELFKSLSGEDIFEIALKVRALLVVMLCES